MVPMTVDTSAATTATQRLSPSDSHKPALAHGLSHASSENSFHW